MSTKEEQNQIGDIALADGLADAKFVAVYLRVCNALANEFGKTIFSGIGIGYADFGIEVGEDQYELKLEHYKSLRKPS